MRSSRAIFWTFYAAVYDAIWDSPITVTLAERVCERVVGAGSILDLGCGTGLVALHLKAGRRVTAVDASAAMVARARRRAAADVYHVGVAPPPAESFDAAIAINVLQVCENPASVLDTALSATEGPVVAVWPTDEVSLGRLAGWERSGGASGSRIVRSLLLRVLVGMPGSVLGIRRVSDARLRALAIDAARQAGRSLTFQPVEETGCIEAIFGATDADRATADVAQLVSSRLLPRSSENMGTPADGEDLIVPLF